MPLPATSIFYRGTKKADVPTDELIDPPESTAIARPTNMTLNDGDGQTTVSWTPSISSDVEYVMVYVWDKPRAKIPAGTNVCVVTGLTNGEVYRISLAAVKGGFRSPKVPYQEARPIQGGVTPLVISLSASATSGTVPFTTELRAAVSGGRGSYRYTWDFGDNTGSDEVAVASHTYTAAGDYSPSVAVTDGEQTTRASLQVSVTASPSDPNFNEFYNWTFSTIPPNNDWLKYASFKGNPSYNHSKLSSTLQSYLDKAYIYHQRLQLRSGEFIVLPNGSKAYFIKCDFSHGYGRSGGGERSYVEAFEGGRAGMPDIRMFGRGCGLFIDNALTLFSLTHDRRWLDMALWYFEQMWKVILDYCDARETWTFGRLTTKVNVNGKGYRVRRYLANNFSDKYDPVASDWSSFVYRGHGYVGGSWRVSAGDPIKPDSAFTHYTELGLCNGLSQKDDEGNGNQWGIDSALEDGLTYPVFARLMRALYHNRGEPSPRGYDYDRWHERARHLFFDNLFKKWQYDSLDGDYRRFSGHPILKKTLSHAHTQLARMYFHLYQYANERNLSIKQTMLDTFMFLTEPLAKDVMWVNLKTKYGEDRDTFVIPHYVGRGGYHRSYTLSSPTWESLEKFGTATGSRKGTGNHKFIYFGQSYDAALDMYLNRYWNDIPESYRERLKTRTSKGDATPGFYLWGDGYMRSTASIMTYGAVEDPADGSAGKKWWNSLHGFGTAWMWTERHNLETLGQGSGDETLRNVDYVLDTSVAYSVMFDNYLTGDYRNKMRDAFSATKAKQDWSIGKNDRLIPNTLEVLDALMQRQR